MAVLSALCASLSRSGEEPPEILLREASAAHAVVSRLDWPVDEFGERKEILAALALSAWRNARRLGQPAAGALWRQEFEEALSRDSVARQCLEYFLAVPIGQRSNQLKERFLVDPESLFAIYAILRERRETAPAEMVAEASWLHQWVAARAGDAWTSEERDYLLGEIALMAGGGCRLIGQWEQAGDWFGRAQAAFRRTHHPEADLARVGYARLALAYEMYQFSEVLAGLPALLARFERLEMTTEISRCRFLEAMTLSDSGETNRALEKLLALKDSLAQGKPAEALRGMVLIKLGELYASQGRPEKAVPHYQEALAFFRDSRHPILNANLKASLGEVFRNRGEFLPAIEAYGEAIASYLALGRDAMVAYLRTLLAETLLLANRPEEAEAEILAALPTIEAQKMAPEGMAAIGLLRESIRRRQADPRALASLREQLRARIPLGQGTGRVAIAGRRGGGTLR